MVPIEPCADHILSAAVRRVFWVGGGGAPTSLVRRRRQENISGGGVRRRQCISLHYYINLVPESSGILKF